MEPHVQNDQYGGIYRGVVVNNGDPLKRGRCKVFVPGVYPDEFADGWDIKTKATAPSGESFYGFRLPWAEPMQPLFCGGFAQNGLIQYPDVGTFVWVMFDSGNMQNPVIVGVIPQSEAEFKNDHCLMRYGDMTIDFDRETNTIAIDAPNIKMTAKNIVVEGGTVSIKGDTVDINGGTGDCVIDGVSLLNHVHFEMQAGDVVSANSVKTLSAKNSL